MRILAIPASNSRHSINRALLAHAARLIEGGLIPDATVELIDINDYEMPIYSPERQAELGILEPAMRLFGQIGASDAVIVSFAEHNGSYSAAFKNIYDWMSRHDMRVYQDKPVAMFATAPGRRGGAGVLEAATLTAPFFGARLVGSLSIPSFGESFDLEAGELTDPELAGQFEQVLSALAA